MPLPTGKWAADGVDTEAAILLGKLARRHPEHTFVIVCRNSGENPADCGYPTNVVNGWTEDLRAAAKVVCRQKDIKVVATDLIALTRPLFTGVDGIVMWAGQHGTSNTPIPTVDDPGVLTKPQDSFVNYAGFLIAGINAWRDEDPMVRRETWICPDARNFLKCRDLKWPPAPVLSLYDWSKTEKHYRYGDPYGPQEWGYGVGDASWDKKSSGIWTATHYYEYSQVEFTNLPTSIPFSDEWAGRSHFGIIINEARAYVKLNRLDAMRRWVLPVEPAFIHGKWSDKSQDALQRKIAPLQWHLMWDALRSTRTTMTTPSSGAGWASTKPWEAFAAGTACMFHPAYDDQGHVIPTLRQVEEGRIDDRPELKALTQWLRPRDPAHMAALVHQLNVDRDAWEWVVRAQRRLFDQANAESRILNLIDQRCGITRQEAAA